MILKKMLKAVLAASLILGMASVVTAEDGFKIGGRVQAHWGQYNAGTDGFKPYFMNYTQSHINVRAASGPMSYFIQLELDSDSKTIRKDSTGTEIGGVSKNNYQNAQGRATYATGDLSVSIGTVSNWRSCGYTQDAQMGNTKSPQTWAMCDLYREQDGISLRYAIAPVKGYVNATIFNTDTNSTTSVVIEAKPIDMLSVYVNSLTSTPTDAATGTTTDATGVTMVGVKATFGNMWAAADQSTVASPADAGSSRIGLQFGMKQVGPGDIALTYGTRETHNASDTTATQAYTNAVYIIPVAKGAQARVFYTSKGNTPYAAGEAGDTTTSTYMGFGLQLTM